MSDTDSSDSESEHVAYSPEDLSVVHDRVLSWLRAQDPTEWPQDVATFSKKVSHLCHIEKKIDPRKIFFLLQATKLVHVQGQQDEDQDEDDELVENEEEIEEEMEGCAL